MPKKDKFPKKLLVIRHKERNGEEFLVSYETLDDVDLSLADAAVAMYELVTVGKFTVEKSFNAPVPKKKKKR